MRNSALSTVTTNSRGVKSSLTRMTLCRRGRSVFGLTLVRGLLTICGIDRPRSAPLPVSHFGGHGSTPLSSLVGKRVVLLAQGQPDGRAGKIERVAQTVDEVAPVIVRHRVGARAEQHEARRARLGLGDVVE